MRAPPDTGYFSAWLPSPYLSIRQQYNHQTQSIGPRSQSQRHKPPLAICRKIQSIYFFHFFKEQFQLSAFNSRLSAKSAKLIVGTRSPTADWLSSENGGADRDRTDDPRVANAVLSQLSYSPRFSKCWWVWVDLNHRPHAYQACALTN